MSGEQFATVSSACLPSPLFQDAALLALAHLETHLLDILGIWTVEDETALRGEAARRLVRQADAVAVFGTAAERLVQGIALHPFLVPGGPLGPAWSAHPFASPALATSYRLREPDLTRGLAALMGPAAGRQGHGRALSFLRLLTDLAGASAVGAMLTAQTRPTILAEHAVVPPRRGSVTDMPAPARARIDLLCDLPVDESGRRAVVVIEAKLGAVVGEGQLRSYREEAVRRARGGPIALILLTAMPDAAERRHRAWRPVRWFALLRRWEALLAEAGDADPEFARLRAHLWRHVLDTPGALQ